MCKETTGALGTKETCWSNEASNQKLQAACAQTSIILLERVAGARSLLCWFLFSWAALFLLYKYLPNLGQVGWVFFENPLIIATLLSFFITPELSFSSLIIYSFYFLQVCSFCPLNTLLNTTLHMISECILNLVNHLKIIVSLLYLFSLSFIMS